MPLRTGDAGGTSVSFSCGLCGGVFSSREEALLSKLAEAAPWFRWDREGGRLVGETFEVDLQIKMVNKYD